MRKLKLVSLLAGALPALLPAHIQAQPELGFEAETVVARGISAGQEAVFFSVAREVSRHATTVVHRQEILPDEDADGTVRLALGREVPFKSVWFAVDLETGGFAVAAPEGFPLREAAFPGQAIPAVLNRLELRRSLVEIVLVRPGVGAWSLRIGDGGAADEDGEADGTLRARLSGFQPVGDSPEPPERFSPGDVLLVLDTETLEFLAVRLRS